MTRALKHWGRRNVPTMSQVIYSIQLPKDLRPIDSNIVPRKLFLARAPSNLGTPLVILKADGSSTKRLISHLKSKHRVYVIHDSENHKTILAQKDIRSQTVKTEMSVFESTK